MLETKLKLETQDSKLNPELKIRDSKLKTRNSKPETRNSKPLQFAKKLQRIYPVGIVSQGGFG